MPASAVLRAPAGAGSGAGAARGRGAGKGWPLEHLHGHSCQRGSTGTSSLSRGWHGQQEPAGAVGVHGAPPHLPLFPGEKAGDAFPQGRALPVQALPGNLCFKGVGCS